MPELQNLLEKKITFINERCLLSRNCNVSCGNCVNVCPVSAVILHEEEIYFDEISCQNCGACRAVCPSEAFTIKDFSFVNEICNLGDQELSIGCSLNQENSQDFNVGCYALLTEGELLYLLAQKESIIFCTASCSSCRFSAGYESFKTSVGLVQELLKGKAKIVLSNDPKNDEGVSRRLFFQWFKQKAVVTLAAALPFENKEINGDLPWRRQSLLAALKKFSGKLSEKSFVRHIKTEFSCTGCGGCVGICPSKAFSLEESKLTWQAKNCLNCGLCLQSCPEKALSYAELVAQEEFCQQTTLKEFNGKRCISCGTYFTGITDKCESCLGKSQELTRSFDLAVSSVF